MLAYIFLHDEKFAFENKIFSGKKYFFKNFDFKTKNDKKKCAVDSAVQTTRQYWS